MGESRSIEILLAQALDGERAAIEAFLSALLEADFFVPEREQAQKMSDAPEYPNPFFNMLAVQDKERVIVPVFSRSDLIFEWCGNELRARAMRGSEIINLMPPQWWICINPAAEVEKELSPWEIDQLRGGPSGIPAILDEILQQTIVEPLESQTVREDEYPALFKSMREFARGNSSVARMCMVRHIGKDLDGQTLQRLLLGVEVRANKAEDTSDLKDTLQALADRSQVGNDRVEVLVFGAAQQDLSFGFFTNAYPFYQASGSPSMWKKLTSRLFSSAKTH